MKKHADSIVSAIAWNWKDKQDEANRKTLDAFVASWKRVHNTETLEISDTIECGKFPIRVKLTPDGSLAVVSCAMSAFHRPGR